MKKPVLPIIFIHVAGWLLFFAFSLTFASHQGHGQSLGELSGTKEFLWFALLYLFVFYFHNLILFPYLYLNKRYVSYFSFFIILLGVFYFLKPFDNVVHNTAAINLAPTLNFGDPIAQHENIGAAPFSHRPAFDIISLIIYILTWLMSASSQLIVQWQSANEKRAKAEAEKARAELAFLKAQINPHFLFNSLNNIYSLAISKNENTPDAIMKLSKIMRYITDEVANDFVPLESEVACLSDYIELQRLRISKKVEVNFSVTGQVASKQIAPLTLVPFVENIFKYGISSHDPCSIDIKINAGPEFISFYCRNKIFGSNTLERIGIGIDNTRRRLTMVYDGKCNLDISAYDGFFTVDLSLNV